MNDSLIRGALKHPAVRFAFAETTALCRDGIIAHNADPAGGSVLADALTATALLAVLLEGQEKYSVKIDYSKGRVGTVLCDVNADGDVRGLIANPRLNNGALTLDALFGKDEVPVSLLKSNEGKILNSGLVNCAMASPSGDIAMFFSLSDQIETEIACICQFRPDPSDPVKSAAGFMLQAMPGCDLGYFSGIREKLHTMEFHTILVDNDQPLELRLKRLLALLALDPTPGNCVYSLAGTPGFRCHCSRDGMKQALLTLGKEELQKLFSEQEEQAVGCRFCNKSYRFRKEDVL